MKVLLINPPDKNMITTNLPTFVEEERGRYPPLGLMHIASYAKENTDNNLEILDMQVEEKDYEDIEDEIKKRKPDVVGLPAVTFSLIDSMMTAKKIKDTNKDIKIIFGGPHCTIYPEETMQLPEVDYVVLGEGEIIFTDLLKNIDNPTKLKNITGLVFKYKDKIINTGRRDFIENLDSLPFPDRKLTPYKKYYSLIATKSPITTMITSRGCPFNCLFCDRPHLGKKFRSRSAKNVVDEIEECVNLGIKEIFIYDDTFTINRQRTIEICDEILRRKIDVTWDVRARVDTVDEALLKKMKSAGCERIHYGVEAGTQRVLNVLRKGITIERVDEIFKITKKVGITTLAYFMMGSPTETKGEIEATINFAKKLNPDFIHFSITTPFPSTDLYCMGLKKGLFKKDCWKEFAIKPTKNFEPPLWEENFTRDELVSFLRDAYKTFYLRPSYIFKRFLKTKSFEQFEKTTKAGLKIVMGG